METKRRIRAHVCWMTNRNMPEVLAVEQESFEFPWSEDDFLRRLRRRNCIGMVAEDGDIIAGFVIYEVDDASIMVLNLAVAVQYRRRGVGMAMIDKLKDKLSNQRRAHLKLEVREGNLPAQLFLRSAGFRAVKILRNHYKDTSEDAYLMQYSCCAPEEECGGIKAPRLIV